MNLIKRQVFYSFHYGKDSWRVSQIRNIGTIEGNRPAPDNDWETIKKGGDLAIQRWIDGQMQYRSCMVLLIGSETADRRWINYEIEKAWKLKMGIVGIYIHTLLDQNQKNSVQGLNPFIKYKIAGTPMTDIVKTYNPPYVKSKDVYNYISENIQRWTNEALEIRKRYN